MSDLDSRKPTDVDASGSATCSPLRWVGDPVYRVPSACKNSYRVFHRDIEGKIVAEFFGPNSREMAEHFCKLFGEPSGSKR